jgi:hypothetical protein
MNTTWTRRKRKYLSKVAIQYDIDGEGTSDRLFEQRVLDPTACSQALFVRKS